MSGSVVYLDASALVKLVVSEAESDAFAEHVEALGAPTLTTSVVGRVELERVARRLDAEPARVEDLIDSLVLLGCDVAVAAIASRVAPVELRALDAIHLATARGLGADLDVMYCYDRRLRSAAEALGIEVRSPGAES